MKTQDLFQRFGSTMLPLLKTSHVLSAATGLDRFAKLMVDRQVLRTEECAHVAAEAGLSASQADEVQLTMEWGRLAGGDVALLSALQDLRQGGRIREARDLVAWTDVDWHTLQQRLPYSEAPNAIAALKVRLREANPMAFLRRAVAFAPA